MVRPVARQIASTADWMRGSQVVPPAVPMLKSGSVPSNRNGIRYRIEWLS